MGFTKWLTVLVFAVAWSVSASAQDVAENAAFGDWIVRCEATPTNENRCRLTQTMTRTSDKSLVVRFIAFPGKDEQSVIVAHVPIGAYLPASPVISRLETGNRDQQNFTWQRCMGDICEAATAISAQELATYKTAKNVVFGYRMNQGDDPIVVRVDVSRLEEGLNAIAVDAAN